jgi:hypothetical protein
VIESNRSTLHNVAFSVFAGAPGTQQDIAVRTNELRLDNSIVFFNTLRATVALNSIANALTSGTAIFIGGGNNTVFVTQNVVDGAGLNSSGVSVNPAFGPNQNVDVIANSIRNARDGINVSDPASGVADLRSNSLRDNRRDGIRMGAATRQNTIENNFLRRNLEHDCHDDSVGTNPGLVANFWRGNDGITENRPGLCRPRDDDDCPDDDEDDDGLINDREVLLLTILGNADSDLDGIKDGNDDANGNGEDDEDEDDGDDDCPNDSDGDGIDDEDEDD